MLIMTQYKRLVNMDNICGFTITEINGVIRVSAIDTTESQEPWIIAEVMTRKTADNILLHIATAYTNGQKFLDFSV